MERVLINNMTKALEFNINGKLVSQVIYDSSSRQYWISPGCTIPLVVVFGNIAFPIVKIKKLFGTFCLSHTYDAENPVSIEEVIFKEISERLKTPLFSGANGFVVNSSRRYRISPRDMNGKLIGCVKEREEIEYELVEYASTDKARLRGIAGGEML